MEKRGRITLMWLQASETDPWSVSCIICDVQNYSSFHIWWKIRRPWGYRTLSFSSMYIGKFKVEWLSSSSQSSLDFLTSIPSISYRNPGLRVAAPAIVNCLPELESGALLEFSQWN